MVGRVTLSLVSVCALACISAATQPVAAQDRIPIDLAPKEEHSDATLKPHDGRLVIDILAPPPEEVARNTEVCEAEQDYARIRGEIVVCRELKNDDGVSGFDKDEWEKRYAERNQGIKNPNVEGAGGSILYRNEGSVFLITKTFEVGAETQPRIVVDFESLPEPPEGSDADRIAQGLPPKAGD